MTLSRSAAKLSRDSCTEQMAPAASVQNDPESVSKSIASIGVGTRSKRLSATCRAISTTSNIPCSEKQRQDDESMCAKNGCSTPAQTKTSGSNGDAASSTSLLTLPVLGSEIAQQHRASDDLAVIMEF